MLDVKLKKLIFLGIIISLILFLSGCTENKSSELSGLEYSNSEHDFGFNPPEGWIADENDNFDVVRFYGPNIEDFSINLGVSGPTDLGDTTLGSLIEMMKQNYTTILTNFTYISSNKISVNNMNAYDFVYSFTQGQFDLKGKQVLIEKNQKVYYATFTATIDSYNSYIAIIDESLNSFTIV
jgi:hypothetical protein